MFHSQGGDKTSRDDVSEYSNNEEYTEGFNLQGIKNLFTEQANEKTLFGKNRHICTASVRRNSGRMLSESLDRRKNSGLSEIITGIRQYSSDIKKLQYFVRVVIKYTICGILLSGFRNE